MYEVSKNRIRFLSTVKVNKFRIDTSLGVTQYCDAKRMDTSKIKLNNHSTRNLESISVSKNGVLVKELSLSSKQSENISIPFQGTCKSNTVTIQFGNYVKKTPLYSSLELTINIDTTFRLRPIIIKAKWRNNILNCKIKRNPALLQDKTSFRLTK
jgi:hypothetical protein